MIAQAPFQLTYFKRFRMEIDLQGLLPLVPPLPEGYTWVSWDRRHLEMHAETKYRCFFEEIDAAIFPSLSNREGCLRLMHEISSRPGFKPEATWLIAHNGEPCSTIQGIRDRSGLGAIQNVGVAHAHRGRGLGSALVLRALHGFQQCGIRCVHLEVTAQNEAAIRLYRRIGFRCRKTLYKPLDPASSMAAFTPKAWFA